MGYPFLDPFFNYLPLSPLLVGGYPYGGYPYGGLNYHGLYGGLYWYWVYVFKNLKKFYNIL